MGSEIIFGLAIFAAFYFILLRPVMQQQRQRKRDISGLGIGDEVLTTGGFYATVLDIRTQESGPVEIALEAAPGVTLRATPDAVQQVTRRASDAAGDDDGYDEDDYDDEAEYEDYEDYEDGDYERARAASGLPPTPGEQRR